MKRNSPLTPLQYEIIRQFYLKIETGEFQPGIYLPGEHELARILMASRWTIRNVIDHLVDQGTLSRTSNGRLLLATPPPPDSSPSLSASVFVWLRWMASKNAHDFVQGFEEALAPESAVIHKGGIYADTYDEMSFQEVEAAFLTEALHSETCRVVVIWRHPHSSLLGLYRKLEEKNISLLFAEVEPPPGLRAHYVGLDRAAGVAMIVRKALEDGYRTFFVLTGDASLCPIARKCLDSVRQTLFEIHGPNMNREDHAIGGPTSRPVTLTTFELTRAKEKAIAPSGEEAPPSASAVINLSGLSPSEIDQILSNRGCSDQESITIFTAHSDDTPAQAKELPGIYWDYRLVGQRAGIRASKLLDTSSYPFVETTLILPEWIEDPKRSLT